MIEQSATLQSATLRRALEALNSICETPPKRTEAIPERAAAPPVPVENDPGVMGGRADGIPPQDPAAWKDDFARWMSENCIHREGREDSAGIGCLLLDFAEWCIAHEGVCCQRAVFETLLEQAGFRCADGMAAGMVLKVDLETVLRSQAAPRAAERQRGASRESPPIRELP